MPDLLVEVKRLASLVGPKSMFVKLVHFVVEGDIGPKYVAVCQFSLGI
jgi:hypothetical protein